MRRMACSASGVSVLLAAGLAAAQPPSAGGGASVVPGPTLRGELALSLQDAIAMSIENNLDVQIARLAPLHAGEDATPAPCDDAPRAMASYLYSHSETPVATSLQIGRNDLLERADGIEAGL